MSFGSSIQFTSREQVQSAFDEQDDLPNFGIFQRSQLVFKYTGGNKDEGSEYLGKILTSLEQSQSIAVYTLALYEKKVERPTVSNYDCAIGFRLRNEAVGYVPGMGSPAQVFPEIIQQLKDLRKEIEELKQQREEEDDDNDQPTTLETVTGLLENPAIQNLINGLMSKSTKQTASLSGVPDNATEDQKLAAAIQVLRIADPQLSDHLLKLAELSQNNPKKFQAILSTVELL